MASLAAALGADLCFPVEAAAAPASEPVGEEQTPATDGETELAPAESDTVADPDVAAPGAEEGKVEGEEEVELGQSPADDGGVVVDTGSGLFESSLAGDEAMGLEGEGGGAVAPAYDLSGYVRGDMFVGKVPEVQRGEIKAAYGEFALKLKVSKGEFGTAYAETRFRYGQQGEVRDLIVDLREAYVDTYWGDFDLRFGHQIIVWGRADAFNPTNNLTPFDLRVRSPIEDDRRMGNVGARFHYNLLPLQLEGVWLPLYAPVEFPGAVVPDFVTLIDPRFPDPELSKGTVAGRLHLLFSAFEMSVSYVHGYAPLPGLSLSGYTVGPGAQVNIARTAYNQHVFGADFSTTIGGEFGLRGEAAYRRPLEYESRPYAPKPDAQYVLGVDRSFGPVSVIAQYAGRYVFDWEAEDGSPLDIGVASLEGPDAAMSPLTTGLINAEIAQRNQVLFQQLKEIQHLGSLRFEWLTAHDTVSLSALGVLNFTTQELLVYPKLEYRITDGMSTFVGGEIYTGPDDTLLGLIDEALTAGYVEFRIGF